MGFIKDTISVALSFATSHPAFLLVEKLARTFELYMTCNVCNHCHCASIEAIPFVPEKFKQRFRCKNHECECEIKWSPIIEKAIVGLEVNEALKLTD